jgi:hypothetical protein
VEREEERRLNMRTLTIASVASATAAAVTSQLWIAGTWIAAALTPVLVTLISEALHRPTERVARAWTAERPARDSPRVTPTREEPTAVTGPAGPMRVYRQSPTGRTTLTRRRIAIGTVAATAAVAFVIGIVALTTADLVSGGSVGKGSGRTTLLGGGSRDRQEEPAREPQQEAPAPTDPEQEQPPATEEPAPEEPPADTAPAPAPPPEEPTPGEPLPEPAP